MRYANPESAPELHARPAPVGEVAKNYLGILIERCQRADNPPPVEVIEYFELIHEGNIEAAETALDRLEKRIEQGEAELPQLPLFEEPA